MHSVEYKSLPWSRTPLRFFYHHSVPSGGSSNTINTSGLSYMQASHNRGRFVSDHIPVYRQLISHGSKGNQDLFGLTAGGRNGNLLHSSYFNSTQEMA